MSRTRDLLITADITVRRSKPTELRGEYFNRSRAWFFDGEMGNNNIYIPTIFVGSDASVQVKPL